jgi:predicted DCC family thiol-disulfide oxidoreductase YuxK
VIENDYKNQFKFASLQSEFGQEFLKKNDLSTEEFNSIILVDGDKYFTRSDAALRIGTELKGIYKWSKFLFVFPKFIRDFMYDIISRNRYKWFGKQDNCWLPTPDLQEKFIH